MRGGGLRDAGRAPGLPELVEEDLVDEVELYRTTRETLRFTIAPAPEQGRGVVKLVESWEVDGALVRSYVRCTGPVEAVKAERDRLVADARDKRFREAGADAVDGGVLLGELQVGEVITMKGRHWVVRGVINRPVLSGWDRAGRAVHYRGVVLQACDERGRPELGATPQLHLFGPDARFQVAQRDALT